MRKKILLINPWIYDFSAYDLWMKPLGLLYIGGVLRKLGYQIDLVDCLEGVDKAGKRIQENNYGCRKFIKKEVVKPQALKNIPRRFSRYGLPLDGFRDRLKTIEKPDLILMTSMMTYWYPGVIKTIEETKAIFPDVPVVLGGKYAEICFEHASKNSGADFVIKSKDFKDTIKEILTILGEDSDFDLDFEDADLTYPIFDLYKNLRYVCILTSIGCPFKCTYCYTPVSNQKFIARESMSVVDEIEFWNKEYGVKNFAFYDDALNYKSDDRLKPILESVIKKKLSLNFHTPNAMNARWIDDKLAKLMFEAGFRTIRLGFETSSEKKQRELGGKIYNDEFERGISYLKEAGFRSDSLGAYVLAGLPGQNYKELIEDIDYLIDLDVRPYIAEYSPIPGTPLFEEAKKQSSFDIEGEPLYQNNSILPLRNENFRYKDPQFVKDYLREHLRNL